MSNFKVATAKKGQMLEIEISGGINEDATFSEIDISGAGSIHVNFKNVNLINSCGVREWIKWVKTIPAQAKLTYSHCPKTVVDQMNMVAGFLRPGSTIDSFQVPYYCEDCNLQIPILFRSGHEFNAKEITRPITKCTQCGKEAEIDVIENKYFKFLGET